jgi:hypothetical protein
MKSPSVIVARTNPEGEIVEQLYPGEADYFYLNDPVRNIHGRTLIQADEGGCLALPYDGTNRLIAIKAPTDISLDDPDRELIVVFGQKIPRPLRQVV